MNLDGFLADVLDEPAALLELVRDAHTTYAIAPAERQSSALPSALMLREGPRPAADACETGDWLHVAVYLSKHPGYTALLFTGSRYDEGVMEWARQRISRPWEDRWGRDRRRGSGRRPCRRR